MRPFLQVAEKPNKVILASEAFVLEKELPPETEVADRHKAVIQRLSLIRLKHFFSCLLAEVLLKGKRKSVHRESEDLKDPPKKKQKISGNIK